MLPDEEALRVPDALGASSCEGKEVDDLLGAPFAERPVGRKRFARLASLAMGLLLSAGAALALGSRALLAKGRMTGAVRLNAQTHETKWGTVPDKLTVSGDRCPAGQQNYVNGAYTFQGTTNDGRPYYKGPQDGEKYFWLYYDSECDGDVEGDNNRWGAWMIRRAVSIATDAFTDLDKDGKCLSSAETLYPSRQKNVDDKGLLGRSLPHFHPSVAKALPDSETTWNVYCGASGASGDWKYMTLRLKGLPRAQGPPRAQGSWVYMRTTMPGERVQLTHGVKSKSGSEVSLGAGSSSSSEQSHGSQLDAGVEFYIPAGPQIHAGAKHDGWEKASSGITKKLQQSWSSSVAVTDTAQYTFQLPKEPGNNALWQWQFEFVKSGEVVAQVLTRDFALTPSASSEHKPRCLPGFCDPKNVPHYQRCVKGGNLP